MDLRNCSTILGVGSYGFVVRKDLPNGKVLAVKVIKTRFSARDLECIKNEISIIKKVSAFSGGNKHFVQYISSNIFQEFWFGVILYEADMYQSIMTFMAQLGKILLIRYSGAHLCVTFSSGESALRAAQYDATEILGHIVRIELRSADWRDILDKVVSLCKNTAVALSDGDQPLLLDENEMSMRMPLSSPTAAGLNDLVILEGEESKSGGKEVAGSLANMVLSEAADLDSASLNSWSGSEGTTPSPQIVQAVKSAAPPPRPPPARPAPPSKKEVVDPWAVDDGVSQSAPVQMAPPPPFVPVQKEVPVHTSNGGHGFDWTENPHIDGGAGQTKEVSRQVPNTAPPVLPGVAPPPPPPRRRVGQQLPDVLRNINSK